MNFIRCTWNIVYRTVYDGTLVRASALTYQTLLAIVPLFAIMIAVAKGFGLQTLLEQTLNQEFRDQRETLQYLLSFSNNTLDQLKEGTLAIIGVIALFFTVTRLLASFEDALNAMWGISGRRSFLRMVSSHISLVIIGPLLFAFSSSITIFVTAQLQANPEQGLIPEYTRTFFGGLLPMIPYVTIALLFSLFLYILPTRKPMWYEALISGILASIAYQILQGTYITLQLELTKMSAVWGSFVALPLFLAWLWASWSIILMGGQLCVALHEHLWRYKSLKDTIQSPAVKVAYMETIIFETQKALKDQKQCLSLRNLSIRLEIPQRLLNPLLLEMEKNNCVLLSIGEGSSSTFVAPLRASENEKVLMPPCGLPQDDEINTLPQSVQSMYQKIILRNI